MRDNLRCGSQIAFHDPQRRLQRMREPQIGGAGATSDGGSVTKREPA